jgi:hypothetical protein
MSIIGRSPLLSSPLLSSPLLSSPLLSSPLPPFNILFSFVSGEREIRIYR